MAAAVDGENVWCLHFVRRISPTRHGLCVIVARNIVTRLTAFLLLCVGVQIMLSGIGDAIAGWNAR